MSEKKHRPWLSYLLVGLYFGWFIWATPSSRPIRAISRYLPGWLATVIWGLWLILLPIGQGPLDVPAYLRVSLEVSFVITTQ